MEILIRKIKKKVTSLKPLEFASILIAILVVIPISNFLFEGIGFILSSDFSLGITGSEEILGTLKLLLLTSLMGGGLGTLNGWLLSNCKFKFRKTWSGLKL